MRNAKGRALVLGDAGHDGRAGTRAEFRLGRGPEAADDYRDDRQRKRCEPLFDIGGIRRRHLDDEIARAVARPYLPPMIEKKIDTPLLGCTHYPLLAPTLREILGENVAIVDSASALVESLAERLGPPPTGEKTEPVFYATDDPETFRLGAERFLGEKVSYVERLAPARLEAVL